MNADVMFGFNYETNKVFKCRYADCPKCLFNDENRLACSPAACIKWLYSEYKEPIKITETTKMILEKIDPKFQWMAKDKNGSVFVYKMKPVKRGDCWSAFSHNFISNLFGEEMFEFLSWSDEEPMNIKELLETCEVIEDD